MTNYSQCGQDLLVTSLINTEEPHYFFDIGCYLPVEINNTYLLERLGWKGIALDITDHSEVWKQRTTPFIAADAITFDYGKALSEYSLPKLIDYLSLDIEGDGLRFRALKRILEFDLEFKIITIEHDAYRGYSNSEKEPQRNLLMQKGYELLCSDVMASGNPYEDWWVNPKHVSNYSKLKCNGLEFTEILKKL